MLKHVDTMFAFKLKCFKLFLHRYKENNWPTKMLASLTSVQINAESTWPFGWAANKHCEWRNTPTALHSLQCNGGQLAFEFVFAHIKKSSIWFATLDKRLFWMFTQIYYGALVMLWLNCRLCQVFNKCMDDFGF